MTYDKQADALKFHTQNSLNVSILQDVNVKHVTAFGILNNKYEPDHWAFGIPLPGIFLVNKNGLIVGKFSEEDYRERPNLNLVLEAAREMVRSPAVQILP
jgi:peroxiredoxin